MVLFWRDVLIWASPCGTRPHKHHGPEGRRTKAPLCLWISRPLLWKQMGSCGMEWIPKPIWCEVFSVKSSIFIDKRTEREEREQMRDGVRAAAASSYKQTHTRLRRKRCGRVFKWAWRIRVESSIRDKLNQAWTEWKQKRLKQNLWAWSSETSLVFRG